MAYERDIDLRLLDMADDHAFINSNDPNKKVGAIITDVYGNVLSFGHNHFPNNWGKKENVFFDSLTREEKNIYIEHAERNAIYNLIGKDNAGKRHTMYATHFPCSNCAKGIVQSGIKRLVTWLDPEHMNGKWKDEIKWAMDILYKKSCNEDKVIISLYSKDTRKILYEFAPTN